MKGIIQAGLSATGLKHAHSVIPTVNQKVWLKTNVRLYFYIERLSIFTKALQSSLLKKTSFTAHRTLKVEGRGTWQNIFKGNANCREWHFKRKKLLLSWTKFYPLYYGEWKVSYSPLNFLKQQLFFSKSEKASWMRQDPGQIEKFHVSLGKQIDLNSLVKKQRCKGDLSLLMWWTVDLVPMMIPVCPSTEVVPSSQLMRMDTADSNHSNGIMSHFCLPCGWTWLISWISEVPG